MNPVIDEYGTKSWYKDGKLHRDDGPAVEYTNGMKEWYKEGTRHRLDGPAIESPFAEYWFKDGKYHREDGPAAKLSNGHKVWFYEGKEIEVENNEEYLRLIRLKAFW